VLPEVFVVLAMASLLVAVMSVMYARPSPIWDGRFGADVNHVDDRAAMTYPAHTRDYLDYRHFRPGSLPASGFGWCCAPAGNHSFTVMARYGAVTDSERFPGSTEPRGQGTTDLRLSAAPI